MANYKDLKKIFFNGILIKLIKLRKDKNYKAGIKIHFDSTSTYGDAVQAINTCKINGNKIYCLFKNDFYIFYSKKELFPAKEENIIIPISL